MFSVPRLRDQKDRVQGQGPMMNESESSCVWKSYQVELDCEMKARDGCEVVSFTL